MPGPENEENRQYIESVIEAANLMVRTHDANVKQRISELRDDEETAPLSRSDSVNVRTDANFAKSALQCISDQADFLQVKLEECDGLENKPDNVKRDVCAKRLLFLEDMFKIKMDFGKTKVEIYKETFETEIVTEIESDIKKLSEKLQAMETNLFIKADALKKLGDHCQLYATSKPATATPYPTPKFSGASNQNLVIWLEKMRLALQDNQVRKNKEVEILRENLDGEAKKLIPDNVIDWNEAKLLLMNVYGDPKILWMSVFNKVKVKLASWKHKYSDKDLAGTESAMEGVRTLQEFLREADLMAKGDTNIQVQFETELDTLCHLCPISWTRKLLKFEGNHAETLKYFHKILTEEYKLLTKLKICYQKETGIKPSKKDSDDPPKKEDRKNSGFFLTQASTCWYCKASTDSPMHKNLRENGLAGCRKFLFEKAKERLKFVNAERVCRKCLKHKFNKFKPCATMKDGSKKPVICTEDSCERNAILCSEHGTNNISNEFQKSLDLVFGKPFENRVNICEFDKKEFTSGTMEVIDEQNAQYSFSVSIEDAMKKLKAQSSKFTTQSGFKPSKILNIPPGEPLFCFVLVEGRTKDHMLFQDSGASNLLCIKNAIENNEFNHVKLHNETIDLKLAGAVTMQTRGEVLLSIPLVNGEAQAMKATLVEKITESFPRIETSDAIKLLQTRAKRDKNLNPRMLQEISGASIMTQTGGDISLLAGQKYAVCSPELVYQDPVTGMGLFKSKYKSRSGNVQYCLAGSIEGLKFLRHGAKFHFYNFLQDVNSCRLISHFAPNIENFPEAKYESDENDIIYERALTKEIEDSLEIGYCTCSEVFDQNLNFSAGGLKIESSTKNANLVCPTMMRILMDLELKP